MLAGIPEDIKSMFGSNVYHVPGLYLLGSGGISHKIMAQKTFSTSLKQPAGGT